MTGLRCLRWRARLLITALRGEDLTEAFERERLRIITTARPGSDR
ncbi:hypothetical protein [Actinomyces radicidentis]|nr:hypothetical protein [Actinomyces radicidentis]